MVKLSGDRFVLTRKVTDYLLNSNHPTGAAKARFFAKFGFPLADPASLIEALSDHPTNNEITSVQEDAFGTKSIVDCNIATPDGRNLCIRTVWMRDRNEAFHRLVTAYPLDRDISVRA